ncbi:uncharacterized protein E0L32_005577 [Thyridium curvatum]|uniref:NADPH-dependent diflavin oxidoreductase 1 n=1 Tax=Thyridium curvatum TaxID=1093900 RepID=A0A507BBH3_9PEZI|nr:uncharacterized protein E0L32_005577 [Thyridium curvatum]TPX14381.1 hypothetical protein E0L32_005577 [Thyridium curvatum]
MIDTNTSFAALAVTDQPPASNTIQDELQERSLLILYASETGNSQDIAEELGRMARRLHFHTDVEEMNDVTTNMRSDLVHRNLVIFVVSTTGQGEFPKNSSKFWKSLLRKKLPPNYLEGVNFALLGLGDSSYREFNFAALKLRRRLIQLGAEQVFEHGEADERHDYGADSIYLPWAEKLKTYLQSHYPLPETLLPIPEDAPLPPKYVLRLRPTMAHSTKQMGATTSPATDDEVFLANRDKSAVLSHIDDPRTPQEQFQADWERSHGSSTNVAHFARLDELQSDLALGGRRVDLLDKDNVLKDHPSKYLLHKSPPTPRNGLDHRLLPIPGGLIAEVTENRRTTPTEHWQDVRHLQLLVENPEDDKDLIPFPGATVTIYPKNFPDDVSNLIDLMGWAGVADTPVEFDLLSHSPSPDKTTLGVMPRNLIPPPHATIRDLLTHNLDITSVPRRTFIEKISHLATNPLEKERLAELVNPDNSQEFYDYTSRPRRTILELLHDFPSVKIPFYEIPDFFPIIRGREFSIANGGDHLVAAPPGTLNIELLVAIVEYKTIIRKPRQGLCSRYIQALSPNDPIMVTLNRGKPPPCTDSDAMRPLIGIATGTGIAPIRSLIHYRHEQHRHASVLLFFGCRSRDADYHYGEEWKRTSGVTPIPAFSRDPNAVTDFQTASYLVELPALPEDSKDGDADPPPSILSSDIMAVTPTRGKNYVQNQIRSHAREICKYIDQGAIICLCGNSGNMPKAVREALTEALVTGGLCKGAAEAHAYAKLLFNNKHRYWEETW